MGYTLEQFSNECHRILKQDPGVLGRKKVCALVQEVLKDEQFVATHRRRRGRVVEDSVWPDQPGLG